jgi:hypothetical protein
MQREPAQAGDDDDRKDDEREGTESVHGEGSSERRSLPAARHAEAEKIAAVGFARVSKAGDGSHAV